MTEQKHFEDDNYSLTYTLEPGCLLKAEVFVKPAGMEMQFKEAVAEISKHVTLPGFRKGKATEKAISANKDYKNMFANDIEKQARTFCCGYAANAVVRSTQLPAIKDTVRAKLKEFSRENGAKVEIDFNFVPNIPSFNPSELHLPTIPKIPVTSEVIEQALFAYSCQNNPLTPSEGRAIQEEDLCDIELYDHADPAKKIGSQNHLQVHTQNMTNDLSKLIGLKAGDTMPWEREGHASTLSVVHVYERPTFTYDDEFAAKLGAKTMDELREKMQGQFEAESEDLLFKGQVNALYEQLLQKFPFDVPNSIIERELENALSQFRTTHADQWRSLSPEQREHETARLRHKIQDSLRLMYLMSKYESDNQINVSQEELLREFLIRVTRQPNENAFDPSTDTIEERIEACRQDAIRRKAAQQILENVQWGEG